MLRRSLNIASIVCLVLCVALMGMWVRSYYWIDMLRGPYQDGRLFGITSMSGQLVIPVWPPGLNNSSPSRAWLWSTQANPKKSLSLREMFPPMGFGKRNTANPAVVSYIPYWFLALATGLLAAACGKRWPRRFTLRSLFIATTFLAVVLGMIAWLDRAWIGR
jgi:hypothetical protein